MLTVHGVAVSQSKEICSRTIVRPLAHSLHPRSSMSSESTRPIPPEIVSNIISFASHSSADPISQSISISHVCTQWREISLSMPALWTSIFLSFPLSKSQITRTMTGIFRSRNRPLDIYMDFRDPSWDWDETSHLFGPKAMDSIMRLLVPHASRWRSLELLTDTWAPIFTFLSCTAAIDSPLLQTIRLARCNEYFVSPGEEFRPENLAFPVSWFRGGTSLSNLRHVFLSGVHIDWATFGLTSLRELVLKYHAREVMPTLSEFRRILCANPGFKRLAIVGWGPRMDTGLENKREDDDVQTINLPQLEELEIGFVDVEYSINLLSLFSLPSLRVLAIEDVAFGIQVSERLDCSQLINHLVEMSAVERFMLPSLRELSLRCIYADDASIRGLLGQLCAMTSLCLDCVDASVVLVTCSALHACYRLEGLTLKNIHSAVVALVLSSNSFPPHLRMFLDVEDAEEEEEEEEEENTQPAVTPLDF